jgi:hypothetical protein
VTRRTPIAVKVGIGVGSVAGLGLAILLCVLYPVESLAVATFLLVLVTSSSVPPPSGGVSVGRVVRRSCAANSG